MDYKPLLGRLGPHKAVPVQASPGVVRLALRLAPYSYQLVYRPRKDMGPADALSRHSSHGAELLNLPGASVGLASCGNHPLAIPTDILVPPTLDFGGPFKGHYFLLVVDAFSKWVELLPVTTPSAGATIAVL
ncbi:uncharacterized protein [Dermacentor albipictus]|uniref:uncharacterized protein n=1 Tax=Dermacentor albipictus TaxID=60249 RepID=UPI0038FBE757